MLAVAAMLCADHKTSAKRSGLVRFGKTDLHVSRLCQGTAFRQVSRQADDPDAQEILRLSTMPSVTNRYYARNATRMRASSRSPPDGDASN